MNQEALEKNVDAFYEMLPEMGPWAIKNGVVRKVGSPNCPMVQLHETNRWLWDWLVDFNYHTKVYAAADNDLRKPSFDPQIRARLLSACGLEETAV